MKLNFKKMFAILLSIMLIVCALPNGLVMAETTGNVAKIGDVEYATLAAALDAAQDGDTIVLLQDIESPTYSYGGGLNIKKAITLDLGGKTITDGWIKAEKNLTVQNGKLVNTTQSYPLVAKYGSTLTVTNVHIEDSKSEYAIHVDDNGSLIFNNSSIVLTSSTRAIYAIRGGKNTNITINSGEITATATGYKAWGIYCSYDNADVIVNGGKITTSGSGYNHAIYTYGDITVNGGEIVTAADGKGSYNYALYGKGDITVTGGSITTNGNSGYPFYVQGTEQTITITGGKITSNTKTSLIKAATSTKLTATIEGGNFTNCEYKVNGGSSASSFTVSGGTFDDIVADKYIAEGATVTMAGKTYTKTEGAMVEVRYLADVNGTKYETLKEAIAALNNGDVLVISSETISEGSIKLPANLSNVTIKGSTGTVLKDMTISAADGNAYSYIGLTFDGITFDNSRLLFTGWRNDKEIIEDFTVTNCTFKNLYDETNTAAIHVNKDVNEPVRNFTFTNNVIDGATGGSKSGIYLQATGDIIITNNTFNNIVFRPALVQLADCDGVVDEVVVSNNVISNTTRLQIYGSEADNGDGTWTPTGTDTLSIDINNNIFQNITGYYICTWGINGEADISKNYYDKDISGKIYWNNEKPDDEAGLNEIGAYPYYNALNQDGTINTDSKVEYAVAKVGDVKFATFIEALQYAIDNKASEVKALCDVREKMTNDFEIRLYEDLTITADAPVKLEFYNEGTTYDFTVNSYNSNTFTIAENVHFDLINRVIWLGYYGNDVDVVVKGYLGGYQIWHGADTTVTETGFLDSHGEAFIMRRNATLTVDGGKVNANYFQIYSGHINATDADIDAGLVWINNNHSYGGEGTVSLTLDNTTFDSKGVITSYAGAGKTVEITLSNGSSLTAKENVTLDDSTNVTLDSTSSFTKNGVSVVPTGSNSPAYTKEVDGFVRVWGEGGGNAKESFVLKLYSGETLLATTTLNNIGGILDGDVYVTWNFYYPSSNDEYWTTVWEEGHPNSAAQPTKVELWIDGSCVATTPAKMSGADDINPVVWKDLGGVKYVVTGLQGSGTQADPYLINNKAELEWFRDSVNAGNSYAGKYVALNADIDLGNEAWTPIGTSAKPFNGVFDGRNYTISNLKVVLDHSTQRAALFGQANNATIKNVKVNNVECYALARVAAIVGGATSTTVENCHVTGTINLTGCQYVGAIVGYGYVTIKDCSVAGTADNRAVISSILEECHGQMYVGGIAGWIGEGNSSISGCSASYADITSWNNVGGITGLAHYGNTVSNCSVNNVTVTGNTSKNPSRLNTVGLIVGGCAGTTTSPTTIIGVAVTETTATDGGVAVYKIYGNDPTTGNTPVTNWCAEVNGVQFTSFIEALKYAIDNRASEVKALRDVREKMASDFDIRISADLTITADAPVKLEFYNEGTKRDFAIGSYNDNTLTIAKNVSFDLVDRVIWIGYWGNDVDVVVKGYLGGYQIWHGADTTVTETGILDSHGEAFVMRRNATLTVDGGKVNANYFQIYSGHINATNADIDAGLVWIRNNHSYGAEGTVSLTLDNTTFDSKGVIEASAGAGKTIDITLTNGTKVNAKGNVTLDDYTYVEVDDTSSFTKNDVPVPPITVYEIDSLEKLINFRDSVNSGKTKYNHSGITVYLTADIDLSSIENWEPIGNFDYSFDGNFNGQGHKIMNLKMSDNTAANGYAYLGFFGVTANNVIENLVIENVTIESNGQIVAAAIAYPYYTEVRNITVCGDIAIKGGNYTAGVLAYTRLCQKASNLTVNGNAGSYITGGIAVGGVLSDIQMNKGLTAEYSNFSVANVTITGSKCVGGISGIIASQTVNGVTVENVTLVSGDNRVGTIAGSFGGTCTVSNITVSNVTGATAEIGGAYDGGAVVEAKVGDTYYQTFAQALAAAQEGDTVKLLDDIYEPAMMLVLPVGVSLDLQTYKLTVLYLVGFNGSHITGATYKTDGSAYGQLVVAKDRVILSSEAYEDEVEAGVFRYVLPVWDTNDNCFVFGRYIINETGGNRGFYIDEENNELRLVFKHKGSSTVTNTFFVDGSIDNAVTFLVRISWISEHGDEIVQDYKYGDEMVIRGLGDYDFGITFEGYQECTNITVTAMLVSSTGVVVAGETHVVNAQN